jgi:long-chain acyl-CoA synthetase
LQTSWSIGRQFRWVAERAGSRVALIDGDRTVSFDVLWRRSAALAGHLSRLPIRERVGIYLSNRAEWVEVFLAGHLAGVGVVPISHRYQAGEVDHLARNGRIALVVVDGDEQRRSVLDAVGVDALSLGQPYDRALDGAAPKQGASEESCILYTSGTTAMPKGVQLTQANQLLGSFLAPTTLLGVTYRDVVLVATPLAHRVGQVRLLSGLLTGARTILASDARPETLLTTIPEHRVTVTGVVPTIARDFLSTGSTRESLGSVRLLSVTGEAMSPDLRHDLCKALPHVAFWTFFASTETGIATALPPERFTELERSSGRAVPGVEVAILTPGGDTAPTGEGEILVRSGPPGSYALGAGYLGAEGEIKCFVDAGGWFHTGDLGRLDEHGWLTVTGRAKDMILSGGLNIAAREVEDAIRAHPAVGDAAVTGEPDERFGERVVAWVVRHDRSLTADDVSAHLGRRLATYKKPRVVYFVNELPRTPSGKVAKWLLAHDEAARA